MRFTYLDGIRGVAALLVLARHWNPLLGFDFQHSYLAVDVFFLLSGFVIAHAYDSKLQSGMLSATDFMAIRFARLYPVYALALAIALMLAIIRLIAKAETPEMFFEWLTAGMLAAAFIPFSITGTTVLFPLNICFWSLTMELGANAAYAYTRKNLTGHVLLAIAAVSASAVVGITLSTGTADHGAFFNPASVMGGIARCIFGITAGLLMYRHRHFLAPIARVIPPWLSFIIVAVVLMAPSPDGYAALHDLISIFVLIPVAVIGAAASEPKSALLNRAMVALGISSYPIYLLHVPVGTVLLKVTPAIRGWELPVGLIAVAALFMISLQLDKRFDMPVRSWLRTRVIGWTRRASA